MTVIRKENEDIESLLKRYRRKYQEEGIATELKKRQYFVPDSQKEHQRKKKEAYFKARLKYYKNKGNNKCQME